MRCRLLSATILLTILATQHARAELRFCFFICGYDAPVADGFTQNYEPVIQAPADSKIVKAVPDPVRKRIERNDALYRCSKGWKHPICDALK